MPQFYPSENNPCPENLSGGYLTTNDKRMLRYAVTKNADSNQIGTIILLQGYGEYIEKYFETITELTIRGFDVATFDWYGQGDTQPKKTKKGFNIKQDLNDFSLFLRNIVYPDCPPPYYLVAYDIGALLALAALDMVDNQFNRLLCISPLLAPYGYKVGSKEHVYHHILADIGLGEKNLKPKGLAEINVQRKTNCNNYINEIRPDFIIKKINAYFIKDVLNTAHKIKIRLQKKSIRVPTLFILSSEDKISNDREVRKLCDYTRHTDYLTIMGVEHDILQSNDHHRKQFWAAFDAFIPGSPVIEPKSQIEPPSYDLECFS